MMRRGSIDVCYCESCSPRRYFTRSVSRSCAKPLSLVTQSSDHPPLIQEAPREQLPTPVSEVQEDSGLLVSRLFDLIAQYWSLIIQDEALPSSQDPAEERQDKPFSPPTTISNDITSTEECNDSPTDDPECDGVDGPPSDAVVSNEEEAAARHYTPSPDDGTKSTSFNLENLLLGEELMRLRVWKATFSNQELNCLPFIEHEVAQGVLKCLIGMANTLIRGYSKVSLLSTTSKIIFTNYYLKASDRF